MILGIETSCDDTSVALVDLNGEVKGLVCASQDDAHRPFGGVVPELASRQHSEKLLPLVERVLTETLVPWSAVTGIAVTNRPGLIGSLLVGLVTAKTLALVKKLPFIGINHIEGHLLAALLRDASYGPPFGFEFPYLGLAVSGGHTHLFLCEGQGRYRILGKTADDAAGEAFDKFAKMLGLGFPGGVQVDRQASGGDPAAFSFPRGLMHDGSLNFSFSGLKTAALRTLEGLGSANLTSRQQSDLCASYQEAIVDVLVTKLEMASRRTGVKRWTITGGVSANSRLRTRAQEAAQGENAILALPPLRYCTDNAAMIALAGLYRLRAGESSTQDLSPSASSLPGDFAESRT